MVQQGLLYWYYSWLHRNYLQIANFKLRLRKMIKFDIILITLSMESLSKAEEPKCRLTMINYGEY